jgi:alkanesulfonate monooxygenase SsuD/methylene tetrahydromethanopterin reductase-like flavin-dependent oxidoreductase (luciferase family)
MRFGMQWSDAEVAREAEGRGISAFTSGEFAERDAYFSLAQMIAGTERALVGPGIAYAFARTPFAHAAAMRQASGVAPGRLFLGLGSGAYSINRDWFGVEADRPVERMSDLVGAVKAWLSAENGQKVSYQGPFYQVDARVQAPVLGALDIPILLAGFNRRMAAASARVGDGVIGHGLFTARWWNEVIRPAMQRGAAEAVRASTALEHGLLITAIDDEDPDRAVNDARRMVGFYLTVKGYDAFVEHHGWRAEVETLRTAFRAGDIAGMAQAVTDEMLGQIAICGSTAEARRMMAERGKAGGLARDVVYLAPPSFMVSPRRRAAYAHASLALVETAG